MTQILREKVLQMKNARSQQSAVVIFV